MRMRYTGISIGYQVPSIFAGARDPVVAGTLLATYNSSTPIVVYLLVSAVISVVALAFARETRGIDYEERDKRREAVQLQEPRGLSVS